MSAEAHIQTPTVSPIYEIERSSNLSMAAFLDQIKPLLNNDFFAPIISRQQWESGLFNGADIDNVCTYLSDSAYTFKDVTGQVPSGTVLTSQVLIALNNTLAPLFNNSFADLADTEGPVKVLVENHVDFANVKAIPGRPGYFTEMVSHVTFAMPVHNPVETCSKSNPTLMHLNITFTAASEINLVTGEVVLKLCDIEHPTWSWNFETSDLHFSMAIKSKHSFKSDKHPSINLNITPLFFGLRHLEDIEQRIHNAVALRIFKNQADFAKLLSQFSAH